MDLVTTLAQLNIQHGTGGPFGAGVFRRDTCHLVAPGINLVLSSRSSVAHAEMVAIMLAQQAIKSHDLGGPDQPPHELVTSCEPCAMCLGAISWSGVQHLACGARGSDAEALGFDEGPKPNNWPFALEQRGLTVSLGIGRKRATEILQHYVSHGGTVYNGRQNKSC